MSALTKLLTSLSQKILETQQNNPLILIIQLLLTIDKNFMQLLKTKSTNNFQILQQTIKKYYDCYRRQKIKSDSQLLTYYSKEIVVQNFVFVLDLALQNDIDVFIKKIMEMETNEQNLLQIFVKDVANRQDFIQKIDEKQPKSPKVMSLDSFEQIELEYLKMKDQSEQTNRKYFELKQQYDFIKNSHEKITYELNVLKAEKYYLLNELGSSEQGSLYELVQKVKKQQIQYDSIIQSLQKQLQQKKKSCSMRDQEYNQLLSTISTNKYEQKMKQLQKQTQINVKLRQQINKLQETVNNLTQKLEEQTQNIIEKQMEFQKLQKIITVHQNNQNKLVKIKKLHQMYKDKIVQNATDFKM